MGTAGVRCLNLSVHVAGRDGTTTSGPVTTQERKADIRHSGLYMAVALRARDEKLPIITVTNALH